METIEVIISQGTRNRIQRIKQLRKKDTQIILDDMEVIATAVTVYWMQLERKIDERSCNNGI